MRIAIPTEDERGRDGAVSEHFGRAPSYAIVDAATGETEVVENHSDHYGGTKLPPEFVADLDVAAVIVDELGERSRAVFDERGVEVYSRGDRETVADLVEAFSADALEPLDPADVHPSGHHD